MFFTEIVLFHWSISKIQWEGKQKIFECVFFSNVPKALMNHFAAFPVISVKKSLEKNILGVGRFVSVHWWEPSRVLLFAIIFTELEWSNCWFGLNQARPPAKFHTWCLYCANWFLWWLSVRWGDSIRNEPHSALLTVFWLISFALRPSLSLCGGCTVQNSSARLWMHQ